MDTTTIPTGDNVTFYDEQKDGDFESQLSKRIKTRFDQDKSKVSEYVEEAKENEKYYFARYIDKKTDLKKGEEDTSVPKLFENLETVVPIVTRKSPEPIVTVSPETKKNLREAKTLENELREAWDTSEEDDGLEMQPKLEENTRNLFCQKIEIFKYYWNPLLKRMCIDPVTLDKVVFPTESKNVYDAPYVIEICTDSLGNLCKKFPKKADELRRAVGRENISDDSPVEYFEYWENDLVAWKFRELVLGYDRNPYWNWPRQITRINTDTGLEETVEIPGVNHFKRPQKPYIMGADIKKGKGLFATSSLVEINKAEVRTIDRRKRQIDKNANLANGQVVIAGKAISKSDAQKLTFSGNGVIYLPEAEITSGAIDILTGRAIDPAVVQDMQDSKRNIDGTTGAYGTVRGEREAEETAAGRTILKDSSYGRSEPLFRLNERMAQKVFNAYAQMLCVYGTQSRSVSFKAADSSVNKEISNEIFKNKTFRIKVKEGSTVPVDKKTLQAQSFDLAKLGKISTLDLYRDLEYKDADSRATRAWQEGNDPQKLYGLPGDETQYNVEAIVHIKGIVSNQIDGSNPMFCYDINDIDLYKAHYKTHADYVNNVEVDEDITMFKDLDLDTKLKLRDHMRAEAKILQTMVQQEMQRQLQLKQAMMRQQEIAATQGGVGQAPNMGSDKPNPALVQSMQERAQNALAPQQSGMMESGPSGMEQVPVIGA